MSNKKPSVTKSELVYELSEKTNLPKSQINQILEALEEIVENSIKSHKAITIPGLVKIYVHKKAATGARQMKSPMTGEIINIPAKPAKKVVKVKAIKNLKEFI